MTTALLILVALELAVIVLAASVIAANTGETSRNIARLLTIAERLTARHRPDDPDPGRPTLVPIRRPDSERGDR